MTMMLRKRVFTQNEVKAIVTKMQGELIKFKINLGRNKFKLLDGVVTNIYPAVFTVSQEDGTTSTFSYFDVACGTVVCKKPTSIS